MLSKTSVFKILNIHASESPVVFRLLGIQFVLGLATSFLITASYSLFLFHFPVSKAPMVYLLAAFVLFPINAIYARLDLKLNSKKLLQLTIVFAAVSMGLILSIWAITKIEWLVLLLVSWNLMIYMVVGYGYWGLASLLFNVRESRRIFSVIGAGDLPAKVIGYLSVSVLAPIIGIDAIMGVSVIFFFLAFFLCKKLFAHSAINWEKFESEQHHVPKETIGNWWMRLFENKLIQWIAALSLVAYAVFYLMDFTFLSEIKVRYKSAHELTAFISLFFATGRMVSIIVKLGFTSRLITRLGINRSLLITPLLILLIAIVVLLLPVGDASSATYLYAFGMMVLICEVLRSTIQEPVFFILFQPLNIHLRLKGHLVAKGYVFPPALLAVGTGLSVWLYFNEHIPITAILWVVVGLIVLWLFTISKIRQFYYDVVQQSIQKGFFCGIALFLNDDNVIKNLLDKTKNGKPVERIHALSLLERSNYPQLELLLNELLAYHEVELQHYVLGRLQYHRFESAIEPIKTLMNNTTNAVLKEEAFKTLCLIDPGFLAEKSAQWDQLTDGYRKALLISMVQNSSRSENLANLQERLAQLALSGNEADQVLLLEILTISPLSINEQLLLSLMRQPLTLPVYKQLIETAGKLQVASFIPEILNALVKPALRSSAIIALSSMKEMVFEDDTRLQNLPVEALEQLAVIAGKAKTPTAANWLLQLFSNSEVRVSTITSALWYQQYSCQPNPGSVIYEKSNDLLPLLTMKKELLQQVDRIKHPSLAQALFSEIEADVMAVLQMLAMQYGRQKLLRVIELMEMQQYSKMHNAIELLELSLPHQVFQPLNEVLDFLTGNQQAQVTSKKQESFLEIAKTILGNATQFNDWTRSLTWWLAGREPGDHILPQLAVYPDHSQSQILKETKEFVIFAHNYKTS